MTTLYDTCSYHSLQGVQCLALLWSPSQMYVLEVLSSPHPVREPAPLCETHLGGGRRYACN